MEGRKIIHVDLIGMYKAGFDMHPTKYLEGIGVHWRFYEGFGLSDSAAIWVDAYPDPMPKFMSIGEPGFLFSREIGKE